MLTGAGPDKVVAAMPGWVPAEARRYVLHTEAGLSIRALARGEGCHASTVLRQVRRVETRRDDPLVDEALRRLVAGAVARGGSVVPGGPEPEERTHMTAQPRDLTRPEISQPDEATIER